jgi:hypothetical protein
MESSHICGYCQETMLERQTHQKENGKEIVKHNCQAKCHGALGFSTDNCGKTFELTQSYVDLLFKYGYKQLFPPKCLDCQIKEVKKDIN